MQKQHELIDIHATCLLNSFFSLASYSIVNFHMMEHPKDKAAEPEQEQAAESKEAPGDGAERPKYRSMNAFPGYPLPDEPNFPYLQPGGNMPGYMVFLPNSIMASSVPWDPEKVPAAMGPPQFPSNRPYMFIVDRETQTDDVGLAPLECLKPLQQTDTALDNTKEEEMKEEAQQDDSQWHDSSWGWNWWSSSSPAEWSWTGNADSSRTWQEAVDRNGNQKRLLNVGGVYICEPPPPEKRPRA